MHQKAFGGWTLHGPAAHRDPLAAIWGPTSKGRMWEGKGSPPTFLFKFTPLLIEVFFSVLGGLGKGKDPLKHACLAVFFG